MLGSLIYNKPYFISPQYVSYVKSQTGYLVNQQLSDKGTGVKSQIIASEWSCGREVAWNENTKLEVRHFCT